MLSRLRLESLMVHRADAAARPALPRFVIVKGF
jgi:hypothetical protein